MQVRQKFESVSGRNHNLLKEAATLALAGTTVFLLVALISYSPKDPSWFNNQAGQVANLCGRVGAQLSALILQGLGIAAFLVPMGLGFLCVGLFRNEGENRFWRTLIGISLAVLAATVFLSIQWKYWPYSGSLLLTGGIFGIWVSNGLMHELNPLGASITSVSVFLIALAASTPFSVVHWCGRTIAFFSRIVWRALKVFGAYTLFLLSILAAKLAHHSAEGMKAMAVRAMERLKLLKEETKRRKATGAGASDQALLTKKPPKPVIDVTGDTIVQSNPVISISGGSEVPNALPELEKNIKSVKPAKPLIEESIIDISELAKQTSQSTESKVGKLAARLKRGAWKLPTVEFLRKVPKIDSQIDQDKLRENAQTLAQKFADFGIDGQVTAVRPGPVITLYEFKPGPGVKLSRIAALADDLSMALSAQNVRILAPLPGKAVVGIEIPSDNRQKVFLREFLEHGEFYQSKHTIPVVMGKDIGGAPVYSDLARMPHLLCAGQTGAGKSVFMNGLICSLLYRFSPDELRMILVDPKFIEFRAYQDIPHLLLPVVDDPKSASTALKWAVREMERRYRILAMMGSRNLAGYNQKVEEMGAEVVRDLLTAEENQAAESESGASTVPLSGADWIEAFEPDESGLPRVGKLPYIVVIIDELADLMMVAKKEVEISIARIAQKARAAGIHLVIATQRPSTDVITGLIKANLPSRVSFQLASYIDSRTILDRQGAERLLGQGDMLFVPPGASQVLRLHGAFVDDDEILKMTTFLKSQGKPFYRNEILVDNEEANGEDSEEDDVDTLYEQALEIAKRSGLVSASSLQRHLKIGYNRAARMVEKMESRGIVGPADGARPREVLMR